MIAAETFLDGKVTLWPGDCLDVLAALDANSIDSCVTDPPYHLTSIVKRFGADNAAPAKVGSSGAYARASAGFMGKKWDGGDIAFQPETWAAVFRVLKPGAHLLAFGGTRTYHRMACAIEDAGFEVRDTVAWLYGSGFPKSHDVSKGIDRHNGDVRPIIGRETLTNDIRGDAYLDAAHGTIRPAIERDITSAASAASAAWQGFGTALKPAFEPIIVARKPIEGTVAANVLKWGVGGLNIDGCRVGTEDSTARTQTSSSTFSAHPIVGTIKTGGAEGRWPANLIHDGSEEVVGAFPVSDVPNGRPNCAGKSYSADGRQILGAAGPQQYDGGYLDSGSAARFFYSSKADSDDRLGSRHPTVKPLDLMQYLVRLVTPKGGTVLDCFAGTGTTGEAAFREGMKAILIEREEEYQNDIRRRMALVMSGPDERAREGIKARQKDKPVDLGPLFGGIETPPRAQADRFTECSPTKADAHGISNT